MSVAVVSESVERARIKASRAHGPRVPEILKHWGLDPTFRWKDAMTSRRPDMPTVGPDPDRLLGLAKRTVARNVEALNLDLHLESRGLQFTMLEEAFPLDEPVVEYRSSLVKMVISIEINWSIHISLSTIEAGQSAYSGVSLDVLRWFHGVGQTGEPLPNNFSSFKLRCGYSFLDLQKIHSGYLLGSPLIDAVSAWDEFRRCGGLKI